LRYGVLTLGGLLHRPFEFQTSSLDLPDLALQGLNLAPGGRQSIFSSSSRLRKSAHTTVSWQLMTFFSKRDKD
jgi:hypothetical protein